MYVLLCVILFLWSLPLCWLCGISRRNVVKGAMPSRWTLLFLRWHRLCYWDRKQKMRTLLRTAHAHCGHTRLEGHNTRDDISVWYCWPQGWVWQKRAAGRRHGQRVVDSAPPTNPIHLLRWQLPILPSDSQLILWSSRHSGSRKQGTRFARCFNDLFDTACLEEGHSLLVSSQLVVQGKQLPNALSYTFGSVPESVVIAWHSFEVRRRTEPSILIMLKNKKNKCCRLGRMKLSGKRQMTFSADGSNCVILYVVWKVLHY